ncbi:chemotaxis protein CheW [Herbaspirillum camelliae]|uniref:chemotaxis protein CheW n=1 Tax=Herbaspirillum camelliae TaxID=1892903 RepID=UPI000949E470|nr:chemotaxis protein CheW [Herbaspirillum camelliae]
MAEIELLAIDDCWNRIGIKGDGSCPQLQQHVRCLNCPTFARAAVQQLDRVSLANHALPSWQEPASPAPGAELAAARSSVLVVRIGVEWWAIATTVVQEVAEARVVHSLPHQRNPAILGVLNIRGALRICVSLAQLFQFGAAAPKALPPKLLVAVHDGQTLVFPVDEVAGVHRHDGSLGPVPTTLAQAAIQYTRGMLEWRGHAIGLLDHELLFYVLNRSMT